MDDQKQKAVFLDRDGTLVEEVDFLFRLPDLRIFPFTGPALDLFKSAGFLLIVITNQSGIARGLYDENAMRVIHAQMQAELDNAIDDFYFCPHFPEAGCECRKPNLKMVRDASERWNVAIEDSWIIGDKLIDIETGFAAGTKTGLVRTGYGIKHQELLTRGPDLIAENIFEAAKFITSNS